MTEDQIEARAEAVMDRLDRALLAGHMSQAEYDAEVQSLDRWTRVAASFATRTGYENWGA